MARRVNWSVEDDEDNGNVCVAKECRDEKVKGAYLADLPFWRNVAAAQASALARTLIVRNAAGFSKAQLFRRITLND